MNQRGKKKNELKEMRTISETSRTIINAHQTKEEEIGSLPEKEFRIMIVKIIQNLENKMVLQTNRLETRIEKMQEMFNKDLEEIKKESINNE